MALNCSLVPAAMLGMGGVIAMETRLAWVTVSVVVAVRLCRLALRVAVPAITLCALPVLAPTVATAALDVVQDTDPSDRHGYCQYRYRWR